MAKTDIKQQIEQAGSDFIGIMKNTTGKEDKEDVVLFNGPGNTTLALPISKVTFKNIKAKIKEAKRKFGL